MKRDQYDIVICGGGVAGLTAAAAFGTGGFTVLIVDPVPPVTEGADPEADLRTTAILQPARDLMDEAGLWSRLSSEAMALQVMRIVDVAGEAHVTRDFNASDVGDAPFGWNLRNWVLRREMVARLDELPNVTFRTGTGFRTCLPREDTNIVSFTDGTQAEARLLIGADGRESAVRNALGIGAKTIRYGQKALSFAVTHDAPHNNISTEVHRDGGPFTLVPLPDHDGRPCSAVVWMAEGAEITRLASLDIADFEAEAEARSDGIFGPLRLATGRQVWPIISRVADAITGPRTALMAEAAHVMPPIGAQGLNMSLADLRQLLDLAKARPEGLGDRKMLTTYERSRMRDIHLRVAGITLLNRTSKSGLPLVQGLRAKGVGALHDMAPVRRGLMKLGLGAS